jgi:transposase
MDVVVARCAGLDVGKRELVACVRVPADGARAGTVIGSRRQVIRKFATFTGSLRRLAGWLAEHGVTEVVMEATGQYWKPVWYALEDHGGFELKLVNAQHVRFLPGRKTDVADAAWLAELLEHGLLRGSFVPPAPIRELRDLTRYRKKLIQAHTAESQRVSKTLEDAGIKLDSVASDVLGVSGRAMLGALLAGERDPAVLAELAKGRLRAKIPILVEALTGRFGAHHAVLLRLSLDHLQHLEQAVATLDEQIDAVMTPFAAARDHLDSIPGVGKRAAENLIAEIGVDMAVFPTAAHLASWACMCPGSNITGGKRRSGKTRPGSPWLRDALVEAAWGASHTKDTDLGAQFWRLARRIGKKKAAVAVGHSILTATWWMITNDVDYHDLGSEHYTRHHDNTDRRRDRALRDLHALGYRVTLDQAA